MFLIYCYFSSRTKKKNYNKIKRKGAKKIPKYTHAHNRTRSLTHGDSEGKQMRDGVTDGGDECRNRNLFLVAIIFPIRIVENTIYVADRRGKKKGDRKQCCLINVFFCHLK